jgi:hypothetical protein
MDAGNFQQSSQAKCAVQIQKARFFSKSTQTFVFVVSQI